VRVRGTCTADHTTEATSAAGRVTQTGPCGHEGCELQVLRRRAPQDAPAATAPATKTTEDAGDGLHRVREAKIRDRTARKRGAAPAQPAAGAPAGAPASDYDEMPPDESNESPAGTRSMGSSRATSGPVGEGLRDLARNGIIIATEQVHTYVGSRTAGQRAVELYRADLEDAERIGDPLARIAGRRDGVGEMSPDTQDLMAAMMGLAGYAAKQIQRKAVADKIDAREGGGLGDVQPMPSPETIGDVA
jgi:hypothetical protein